MYKYVTAVLGIIVLYLILSKAREFNSTISSIGNITLRGIGVLQGRSGTDITGVQIA